MLTSLGLCPTPYYTTQVGFQLAMQFMLALNFPLSSSSYSCKTQSQPCSPGWPGTRYIDQAGLKQAEMCLPLSLECWDWRHCCYYYFFFILLLLPIPLLLFSLPSSVLFVTTRERPQVSHILGKYFTAEHTPSHVYSFSEERVLLWSKPIGFLLILFPMSLLSLLVPLYWVPFYAQFAYCRPQYNC